MQTQMQAVTISQPGNAEVLTLAQIPVREPASDEILIRVEAAGINRPDILQRQGLYPAPKGASEIPGLEIAGTVVACGSKTRRYKPGDRVLSLVTGGGYAQFCLAKESSTLPVPETVSMVEAGAIPETFFTVWTNVFDRARLNSGEIFLVHGGSSGIGTTAIQMAKAMGARVFATAGSDEKVKSCQKLGAEKCFNYKNEDFVEQIKTLTDNHGADVILDMVGGDYIARNIKAAAIEGRIVSIAFLHGSKAEINFMPVMLKRLTITGSTLRIRSDREKAAIAEKLETRIWPLLAKKTIKPQIFKTFPLAQAADAHRLMESSTHIGKIILLPWQ